MIPHSWLRSPLVQAACCTSGVFPGTYGIFHSRVLFVFVWCLAEFYLYPSIRRLRVSVWCQVRTCRMMVGREATGGHTRSTL